MPGLYNTCTGHVRAEFTGGWTQVTVDKDMCIVCIVGDLERENIGFEALAVDALHDIPVRMISYGGSNYNISLLIRQSDKKRALQQLSDKLFNDK